MWRSSRVRAPLNMSSVNERDAQITGTEKATHQYSACSHDHALTLAGNQVLTPQMISAGCALAAYGEVHFELSGFLCQCAAIAFEASRLVMIQILLHGLKMDPIVSLHYYAPVCAGINMLILPFTEGLEPFYALHRVGLLVLFSNAGIAFALNVAAVFLISVGSGLILTLAGVAKDILLISGSVVAFGSRITFLQVLGYS